MRKQQINSFGGCYVSDYFLAEQFPSNQWWLREIIVPNQVFPIKQQFAFFFLFLQLGICKETSSFSDVTFVATGERQVNCVQLIIYLHN